MKLIKNSKTKNDFMNNSFQSKTGSSFSAENFSVVFREGQVVLDFKKTAPRIDNPGEKKQTIVSEHQPVVMNPEKAKAFKELLDKNIEKYEEKHGEIELKEKETENDQQNKEDNTQDYIA